MRKILLMPDFPDHVLWDRSEGGGPAAPEDLGLSAETCGMLWEWYKWWGELDVRQPLGKDDIADIDRDLFDVRGIEIWRRLRRELSGRCEVAFYSHRFGVSFEESEKLEELFHVT